MQQQKPKAHGGARPGSGRKPHRRLVDVVVRQLQKATAKRVKETGLTPSDVLLQWVYSDDPKTSLAALRIWSELVLRHYPASAEAEQQYAGPGIFLPKLRPDPAKVIPMRPAG